MQAQWYRCEKIGGVNRKDDHGVDLGQLIDGTTPLGMPKVGERFQMFDGLNRVLLTSLVTDVINNKERPVDGVNIPDGVTIFWTKNSAYKLGPLEGI